MSNDTDATFCLHDWIRTWDKGSFADSDGSPYTVRNGTFIIRSRFIKNGTA